MYPFLSPEWIDAARQIRDEFAPRVDHDGADLAVNLVVTGVPGLDDVEAHAALRTGRPDIDLGHDDSAAVLITLDYATARAAVLDQDLAAVARGFLLGKIVIRGDLASLLGGEGVDVASLLTMAETVRDDDPLAGQVAERIRAITR
jgi:hypothetical protein